MQEGISLVPRLKEKMSLVTSGTGSVDICPARTACVDEVVYTSTKTYKGMSDSILCWAILSIT